MNKKIKDVKSDSDYEYICFDIYNIYINFQIYDGGDLLFYMMRDGYDQKMKRREERKKREKENKKKGTDGMD